jgi:hypothetical protein
MIAVCLVHTTSMVQTVQTPLYQGQRRLVKFQISVERSQEIQIWGAIIKTGTSETKKYGGWEYGSHFKLNTLCACFCFPRLT